MKPVEILQHSDSPVIVSVPHGSGDIPTDIQKQLRRKRDRGPCDTGTREIATACAASHATVILAGFSRIVIDVNRYPEPTRRETHPEEAPEEARQKDTERLVRRYDGNSPLWKAPLSEEEIRRRIENYHQPFHAALATEIGRVRRRGEPVLLVDLHSMADDTFEFILGDNGGRSAGRTVCLLVRRLLCESFGTEAERVGYAGPDAWDCEHRSSLSPALLSHTGGFVTVNHGKPRKGVFAIQIEISRFLFWDRKSGTIRRKEYGSILEKAGILFERLTQSWKEYAETCRELKG